MQDSLIRDNTPVEEYSVGGIDVFVKREDLCTAYPMPPLAKLRGAELLLKTLKYRGVELVGHHDSWYSRAGWGIAIICRQLDMRCIVGYPQRKGKIPEQLSTALCCGAELYPVRPNFIRVNYAMTKKYVEGKNGYMLPFALACPESTIGVAKEAGTVPEELLGGSLVLSVGSGTILSGLLLGLQKYPKIYGVSAGMSEKNQRKNAETMLMLAQPMLGVKGFSALSHVTIIPPPSPYEYEEEYPCPFPSHPNYDRKAWRWLCEHIGELEQPILFWNIGV